MIKLAETPEEIEKALELRYEVQFKPWGLTREQSVKEQPSGQSFTIIFDEDGQILAAATAFVVGDGKAELLEMARRSCCISLFRRSIKAKASARRWF